MPMPIASIAAAASPASPPPMSAPKATPTARPSGMLCTVTATHITADDLPLPLSLPMARVIIKSVSIIMKPPSTKPDVSTI